MGGYHDALTSQEWSSSEGETKTMQTEEEKTKEGKERDEKGKEGIQRMRKKRS